MDVKIDKLDKQRDGGLKEKGGMEGVTGCRTEGRRK